MEVEDVHHSYGRRSVLRGTSYGAMQASTTAGFSNTTPLTGFAVQLAWFIASALVGLIAFHRRTRSSFRPTMWPRIPGPMRSGQPAKH